LDGDDVLFTDDMRAKVEAEIGEKLVEAMLPGLEGQVTLVPESEYLKTATPTADKTAEQAKPKLDPKREGVKKSLMNILDEITDPLAVNLDWLEKVAEDYADDEELAPLIEQAVNRVVNAEDEATAKSKEAENEPDRTRKSETREASA